MALKRFEKRASLGVLFLAVQFVDIVFFPLVLLGIERLNIVENFTQSTHFELEYMPYTHSLLAFLIWSGLAYALFRWVIVKSHSVAVVVALAVMSHWLLDVIVHTPDLPIWNDASPKLGLGLWNNAIATYALEAALLLAGLWLYLRSTSASTRTGKYGMTIFVLALLLVNIANIFGPLQGDSTVVLASTAVASYLLFAAAAFWLDTKRS
ncbi:MAG: hypothetical protein GTO71_04780 [Woeseiaceae bacterium]|nr:hypothetical protein [Woeseiaceae bacterium]NIP20413.1 hypothetical protein [Woeseiaceae bacterium]